MYNGQHLIGRLWSIAIPDTIRNPFEIETSPVHVVLTKLCRTPEKVICIVYPYHVRPDGKLILLCDDAMEISDLTCFTGPANVVDEMADSGDEPDELNDGTRVCNEFVQGSVTQHIRFMHRHPWDQFTFETESTPANDWAFP